MSITMPGLGGRALAWRSGHVFLLTRRSAHTSLQTDSVAQAPDVMHPNLVTGQGAGRAWMAIAGLQVVIGSALMRSARLVV